MKKYKYLVVNGCSQTFGQNCDVDKTWPKLLADKYGLELINLATPGTGWNSLEDTTTNFIHNNRDIIDECFFILQKSMLEREFLYEYTSLCKTDVWEKYNMSFVPHRTIRYLGYNDIKNFHIELPFRRVDDKTQRYGDYEGLNEWTDASVLSYLPEHKHYPNSRHNWKLGESNDIVPPWIHEQFEQLMLHWSRRMLSFHLFLTSLNIDHLMVDGYSPFLSYKLDFRNYYDTDEEFEFVKKFWGTISDDPDDEMVYDFKNIKSGWVFDSIDNKYKIDDVVLWSLYQFKTNRKYNDDGGHAGPKGMELIADVIEKNLKEKGWF